MAQLTDSRILGARHPAVGVPRGVADEIRFSFDNTAVGQALSRFGKRLRNVKGLHQLKTHKPNGKQRVYLGLRLKSWQEQKDEM